MSFILRGFHNQDGRSTKPDAALTPTGSPRTLKIRSKAQSHSRHARQTARQERLDGAALEWVAQRQRGIMSDGEKPRITPQEIIAASGRGEPLGRELKKTVAEGAPADPSMVTKPAAEIQAQAKAAPAPETHETDGGTHRPDASGQAVRSDGPDHQNDSPSGPTSESLGHESELGTTGTSAEDDGDTIPLTTLELAAVKVSEDPAEADAQPTRGRRARSNLTVPAVPVQRAKRLGPYPLLETLGAGGMAVIYRSLQESLKRTVALKVLKPEMAKEEMFATRFKLEAQTLAGLQHENIVQIYDHRIDDGLQYMVMEYLDGVDLFELIDKHGPLPPDLVGVLGLHVARALEHIHYRGIVHRDIKPANVMVTTSGSAKLMDFGIARIHDEQELTRHGTGLGTPSYMSPEQVMGDKLDGRTDIFSLGTLMFEMVTGQKPFLEDDSESVLEKIRSQRAPRARKVHPSVPRDLDRVIARCHQPRKQDRYWPTRELVKALERFLADRGVESEQALVVSFLRDRGIITEEQAEKHLSMAKKSGYRATGPVRHLSGRQGRGLLLGIAFSLLALLGMGVGLYFSMLHKRPGQGRASAGNKVAAHQREAEIRFVVSPWAHVYVDGRFLTTTPTDRTFPLEPGRHEIKLVNPYCSPVSWTARLQPGQTLTVHRRIDCPHNQHRPPDSSGAESSGQPEQSRARPRGEQR